MSHLTEPEARAIAAAVVGHLLALHAQVSTFGVHLDGDGFWFTAVINGLDVHTRVARSSYQARSVARDMVACVASKLAEPKGTPESCLILPS